MKTEPEPDAAPKKLSAAEVYAAAVSAREALLIAAGTPRAAAAMLAKQAEDQAIASAPAPEKKGGK